MEPVRNVRRRRRRRGDPRPASLLRQPVLLVHRGSRHPRPLRRSAGHRRLQNVRARLAAGRAAGAHRVRADPRPGVLRMGVPGEPAPRDRGLRSPQAAHRRARDAGAAPCEAVDRPCRAGPVSADRCAGVRGILAHKRRQQGHPLRCRDRRLGAAGHRADGTVLGLSRVVPLAVPAGRLLRGAWPIRPGKREDRSRSLHSLRRVQACMPVRSRDPRASARRMRRDRAGRRLHGLRFVHRRLPHARPVVHPGTRLQAGRPDGRGRPRGALWCSARLRDAPEAAPFARAAFPFTRSAACA